MFWDRFYNLCIEKGTRPNPVAKELCISSAVLTKWKNGISYPNGEILIKIADYFDCSIDYLVGISDIKSSYKYEISDNDLTMLKKFHNLNADNMNEILLLIDFKLQLQEKRNALSSHLTPDNNFKSLA